MFIVENEIPHHTTNKSRFIEFIGTFLRFYEINVLIARDDKDSVIVSECLTINQDVEVISEDTDVLLLMLHHLSFQINQTSSRRYFLTTQKGTFDLLDLLSKLTISERKRILLIHALQDVTWMDPGVPNWGL